MSATTLDWLNLLIRWAHLIAAIGWIGTSFYFIALDLSLRRRETMNPGVAGTAWEVHGGGFYHVEKYMVAPSDLPPDLLGIGASLPDTDDLRSALRHYERLHITRVLKQCPDKKEAAKRLKLGLSSLYRKIEELKIELGSTGNA